MPFKKIGQQLNFVKLCRENNLPIWQCPSFLFILIGLTVITTMLTTYFIGSQYVEPEVVALIVTIVTGFLMVTGYFVIQGFETLAQANQMKSDFVSIVSHQLRTPLTGIKWTIDLMGIKNPDKKVVMAKLKDIEQENQRMIELVNDLLNVSRIEQRRLTFQYEQIALVPLVQKIIKEYTPLTQARNVKLVLEKEENLPVMFTDPHGVKHIISNLIDNAVKYTKEASEVKIKLSKRKKFIRCEVQDQGVGIPKKDQGRVFQKFFRSKNILKHQTTGSGLGLFIAKAFTEALGGKINFNSQEGQGSTFWTELPIKSSN